MQYWNKIWETMKYKIISYILKLEKKGYTIPINDKNNELFTQNKFINSCTFVADIVCIIITLLGMTQQLITFFGVMTYCVYTLCDQVKIFYQQYSSLNSGNGYFKIKNSAKPRKIPPNLPNVIFLIVIFFVLLAFSILKATGGTLNLYFYNAVILVAFFILFYIKVKYMIYDVLGISKWKYIDESITEEEVKI